MPTKTGSTPLFTVAWDGNVDIARLLLDNGAKVNWKNLRGNTALHMAIEQNHEHIVKLFLDRGATFYPQIVADIRKASNKLICREIDELIVKYEHHNHTGITSEIGLAIISNDVSRVRTLLRDASVRASLDEDYDREGNPM